MRPYAGTRATRPSQMWLPSSRHNNINCNKSPPAVQVIIPTMPLVGVVTVWERALWGTPSPSPTTSVVRTARTRMRATLARGCVAEARLTSPTKRSAMHPRPRRIQQQQRAPSYHSKEHIPGSSFISARVSVSCVISVVVLALI